MNKELSKTLNTQKSYSALCSVNMKADPSDAQIILVPVSHASLDDNT